MIIIYSIIRSHYQKKINLKNVFVVYDSENIIMRSSCLWNKKFYDIKE